MLKFNTDAQPEVIDAKLVVRDATGDLALRLNGLTVLYINADSGGFSLSELTIPQADRLRHVGLNINDRNYLVEE